MKQINEINEIVKSLNLSPKEREAMSVYHIWPCDTWCSEEELEDFLSFMSDDYITISVLDELEDYEVPSYNEAVESNI